MTAPTNTPATLSPVSVKGTGDAHNWRVFLDSGNGHSVLSSHSRAKLWADRHPVNISVNVNRRLASVLNWLDALRTPVRGSRFSCSITRGADQDWSLEINNLKVWVYFDQRQYWIAQGLDIGYVASAKSLEEAETKFIRGLATTLIINLEKTGSIERVARPAPPEVWLAWRRSLRSATSSMTPKHVVSEDADLVPGLHAPVPKLGLEFYGCPV